MKKLFTLFVTLLVTFNLFAQAPQKMSYQFVVRNAGGALVSNSPVGVRIAILQGSSTGTVVYQELFNPNPQTNANGLVSIEIGTGLPITGTFSAINWTGGPYYLKTETDPAGGTSYTVVGTSQLISVPYALYSKTTESIPDNSVTSAKIVDGAVATTDLSDNAVSSAKIADGTIATADIANSAVTAGKISGTGAGANDVLQYTGSAVTWGYAPGSIIKSTLLNVTCPTSISINTTYAKLMDVGTVVKSEAASKLEVTFHGRLYVESMTGNGAVFELRINNTATTNGRARATLRASEAGGFDGVPVSMTGIFTGYGTGNHTVSIWVQTGSGTGTKAMVDPGCWSSDHVVVREVM